MRASSRQESVSARPSSSSAIAARSSASSVIELPCLSSGPRLASTFLSAPCGAAPVPFGTLTRQACGRKPRRRDRDARACYGAHMLRRTYDWIMRLSASREAPAWLALLAFCEGIFFPIPPDVMLAPLVLGRRERAWAYAGICLCASV